MRKNTNARRIGLMLLLVLGLALGFPGLIRATANIFVKFDGVSGECTDRGHEQWIEVGDYLWGQSMPEDESKSAGQTGVERAIPGRLTIAKRIDRTSPMLAEIKAKGGVIASVVFDAPRKDGKTGRVITTMKNVKIVALAAGADGSSEKVTCAYRSYRVVFTSTSS